MPTTGNASPHGLPVSGLIVAGPVVVTFLSLVLRLTSVSVAITKKRSVSIGRPAPMIESQYPGALSSGVYLPAACEVPVKKCDTTMTLSFAALRRP